MEALQAIDTPCDVIFAREAEFVPSAGPERASSYPSTLQVKPPHRPRQNRVRDNAISRPFQAAPKLLFIRDISTTPPIVAKMACPDCSRGDFTNLQGLLNHCRLLHSKDYGSHDECMHQCAVIVPEEDRDWVVANGTELAGANLPSLRRLFEIAVEDNVIDTADPGKEDSLALKAVFSAKEKAASHITKTLGHHKDTPALAPFLGRVPIRRCIHIHGGNEPVDIDDSGDLTVRPPGLWRMLYAHRNAAKPEPDAVSDWNSPQQPRASVGLPSQQNSADVVMTTGTRFHIVARVVISDRSLWLPPGERPR
jgi:hypothetical protein